MQEADDSEDFDYIGKIDTLKSTFREGFNY